MLDWLVHLTGNFPYTRMGKIMHTYGKYHSQVSVFTDCATFQPPPYDPRAHAFSLYQRLEALDEERKHEFVGRMVGAEKFHNL